MKAASNQLGLIQISKPLENYLKDKAKMIVKGDLRRAVTIINEQLAASGSEELKRLAIRKAVATNAKRPQFSPTLNYREPESVAYACTRMIPTYSVLFNIMTQLSRRCPDFKPSNCLDFGIGTGSGALAASTVFKLGKVTGVDVSQSMLNICKEMNEAILKIPELTLQRHVNLTWKEEFDLVIGAFSLSEIQDEHSRLRALESLWNFSSDVLVLVERGTPVGFDQIINYRNEILRMSKLAKTTAYIVAPVLHINSVPMKTIVPWLGTVIKCGAISLKNTSLTQQW